MDYKRRRNIRRLYQEWRFMAKGTSIEMDAKQIKERRLYFVRLRRIGLRTRKKPVVL